MRRSAQTRSDRTLADEPWADGPFGTPAPIRSNTVETGSMIAWDAAIVIPAKNEERRIVACLDAVAVAIRHAAPCSVGVIVVVNNTSDATAIRALAWARVRPALPITVIDCVFAATGAGVGAARRLGLDFGCRQVPPGGALLTTDADTRVRQDWVAQNLVELHYADLICGTVRGDPEEERRLPAKISAHGSAETDYLAASVRLAAHLDPQLHDPAPAHHNPAGASMAVSRRIYEAVGGLPAHAIGEDTAFADIVSAHDFRVRFSATAIADVSCRMTGRTGGGMAGTLRERALASDPWADEWLEPADILVLRHELRGKLRTCWPDRDALRGCLVAELGYREADTAMSVTLPRYFGAFLNRIEARSTRLTRRRMRLSDCRRELPRVRAILAELAAGDGFWAYRNATDVVSRVGTQT